MTDLPDCTQPIRYIGPREVLCLMITIPTASLFYKAFQTAKSRYAPFGVVSSATDIVTVVLVIFPYTSSRARLSGCKLKMSIVGIGQNVGQT